MEQRDPSQPSAARPDPKPEKETAAQRTARRIARRKARKKRRPEDWCLVARCIRHVTGPARWGRCQSHFLKWLNAEWSRQVRAKGPPGVCVVQRLHERYGLKCGGPIQGCHIIGRFYGQTLWLLENGLPGCRNVNGWAEQHVLEWEDICREYIGSAEYDRIRALAVQNTKRRDDDYWVHYLGLDGNRPSDADTEVLLDDGTPLPW